MHYFLRYRLLKKGRKWIWADLEIFHFFTNVCIKGTANSGSCFEVNGYSPRPYSIIPSSFYPSQISWLCSEKFMAKGCQIPSVCYCPDTLCYCFKIREYFSGKLCAPKNCLKNTIKCLL